MEVWWSSHLITSRFFFLGGKDLTRLLTMIWIGLSLVSCFHFCVFWCLWHFFDPSTTSKLYIVNSYRVNFYMPCCDVHIWFSISIVMFLWISILSPFSHNDSTLLNKQYDQRDVSTFFALSGQSVKSVMVISVRVLFFFFFQTVGLYWTEWTALWYQGSWGCN